MAVAEPRQLTVKFKATASMGNRPGGSGFAPFRYLLRVTLRPDSGELFDLILVP